MSQDSFIDLEQRYYKKDFGSATLEYQPSTLELYKNDPWDLRISIDDRPLEESFYFTFQDPELQQCSLLELIESHALNPRCADQLDIRNEPELPFLQMELLQLFQSHQKGEAKLSFFINHSKQEQSIKLEDKAASHLSVCSYFDESYDYLLVDLVFSTSIPIISEDTIKSFYQKHAADLALTYINAKSCPQIPSGGYLDQALQQLIEEGFLNSKQSITQKGDQYLKELASKAQSTIGTYQDYRSVSIFPPALGIPDGFDVRLQMMEKDGLDLETQLVLWSYPDLVQEMQSHGMWIDLFETGDIAKFILTPLQSKTHFSPDLLETLIALKA